MKISADSRYVDIFVALASKVRLDIIQILSKENLDLKTLAARVGLSPAIMTMHIRKLEHAGIISTQKLHYQGASHKVCSLIMHQLEVGFPSGPDASPRMAEFSLPVGHYTDFEAHSTCGLATTRRLIGNFDDQRAFLDPARMDAGIVWLCDGFLEYRVPNHLPAGRKVEALEISMELGSEAKGYNNDWPSDLYFTLNGHSLGCWTSPGDFGGSRGRYSPPWWGTGLNHFGTLVTLRIGADGLFINGVYTSDLRLDALGIEAQQWVFRLASPGIPERGGGLTVFGSGFGNYDQDIVFRLYYT